MAGEKDVILDDITQTEELDGGLRVKVSMNKGLIITDDDDRELYTISEANGLCSDQVAYVAYDGHGMLWGATSHGVFAIEMPSVYSYILGKDGLAGEVYAITAFDGDFYVGGTNGLYRISSRQCQRMEAVSNICWALCHQGDYMLAATSSGIYRIGRVEASAGSRRMPRQHCWWRATRCMQARPTPYGCTKEASLNGRRQPACHWRRISAVTVMDTCGSRMFTVRHQAMTRESFASQ